MISLLYITRISKHTSSVAAGELPREEDSIPLLNGYRPVPDAIDRFSGSSVGIRVNSAAVTEAALILGNPFDEFFNFSFGTVEDEESKTPNLVSSSSNPRI